MTDPLDEGRQTRKPYRQPDLKPRLGRPYETFDLEQLERLSRLGCTDEELADWFDCSTKTIERRKKDSPDFSRAYKRGRNRLKESLRRILLKRAIEDGSPAAAIFLAKNLLGMQDKPELVMPITDEDDWIYRTRLASGDTLVIPAGTDPIKAYHEHIRGKGSEKPRSED